MADTDVVNSSAGEAATEAASAPAEDAPASSSDAAPSPSASHAPPAPQAAPGDPLAKALQTLFLNVTTLVQGELQVKLLLLLLVSSFDFASDKLRYSFLFLLHQNYVSLKNK